MSAFYNLNVGFLLLEYGIFATRTSDFHNSDVGFLLLGYGIFTTRMSDFYYTNVAFLQLEWMWDFYNSDVGFYNLDAIFTTQMAPTRSVDYIITRVKHFLKC